MLDTYLRPKLQPIFVEPFLKTSLAKKLTPNMVTIFAGVAAVISAMFLVIGSKFIAVVFLLLSAYFDILDGSIARAHQKDQPFGAVVDIVMDRFVEFTIIFALFAVSPVHRGSLCMLMMGSVLICVTTFLISGIFTANNSEKSFHYSPGLMERTEAFIFFTAMMLFPQAFSYLAWAFILLVGYTAARRILELRDQLVDHSTT